MPVIYALLADDHAIVRAGIRKVVEEITELAVVAEVGDGPGVLRALEQAAQTGRAIDLLLIDVTMPEFEPVSAIRGIHKQYPRMKILVVSAYDDDAYVQGLLSAGVNGYHLKDQPLSDLRLAVQRVLEGERWISGPLIDKLVAPAGHRGAGEAALPLLTNRQRELLRLLREGKDNQSIAQEMNLSIKTVENHLTRLYRLINVQSRLEAVNYMLRRPEVLGVSGQQAGLTPADATEHIAGRRIAVLVVDDNARYRSQVQRMIGKVAPAAMLYEAENIVGAVQTAQHLQPNLVLIDVVLGDEDGIQCARRVKKAAPNARIVLISAYPDREFHRLGLQAGAVAFLDKKDLDLPTLRQVVEDLPL